VTTHLGRLWNDALLNATHVHRDHARKGSEAIPYVSHLLSVAALVLEDGGSEEDAVAVLLHDAVEDQGGQRAPSTTSTSAMRRMKERASPANGDRDRRASRTFRDGLRPATRLIGAL
jgi:hypothetical protein